MGSPLVVPQEHRDRAALIANAHHALYEIGSPLVGRILVDLITNGPADSLCEISRRIGVPRTSILGAVRRISTGSRIKGKVHPPVAKFITVNASGDGNAYTVWLTPQGRDLALALIGL